MAGRRIIIDCDPGQDDAVALFLAFASRDELDIAGVTTVAGNVPLELTERNARMMCDIAGVGDIGVYAGCNRPMKYELETAEYIHGKTGIDGVDVFEPATRLSEGHAVSFIVDTLLEAEPESITLVPTGPLTNIATAITNIMAFSIKVASVMGKFKAVPKQAHLILFLSRRVLVTPKVVIPNMTIVIISAN